MLKISNKEFKVKGYNNRWSVVDTYENWALLENCIYGDETFYLVVRKDVEIKDCMWIKKGGEKALLPTISDTEVICETYDDLITALEDECLI